MNRGLYTAATGMMASQRMLDVTANNLANVSTNGFKSDGLIFKDALEANMSLNGRPVGQMSFGVQSDGGYTNFEAGSITQTGNPLDVAIADSKGAFKVDLGDNKPHYTRDGAFRLDDQKQLVNQAGHPILDNNGSPIVLDGNEINIQKNGDVMVDGKQVATLGIYEGTFVKEGQNLYTSSNAEATDKIGVQSNAIEGSNVNAVEAMVQMITLSRSFDMAQKAVQQHDELSQKLIQSLGN